jgi:hypothetical protein
LIFTGEIRALDLFTLITRWRKIDSGKEGFFDKSRINVESWWREVSTGVKL